MKKKIGRPSKLSNKVIAQVEILAGMEHTEEEIAQVLGVTALTIINWKSNKEFLYAIKRGKAIVDSKVTKSLIKRALGYSYKEITRKLKNNKMVVTEVKDKMVVPDVVAMIFWLKNRKKGLWRDVVEKDINVKHTIIQQLHDLAESLDKPKDENRIKHFIDG